MFVTRFRFWAETPFIKWIPEHTAVSILYATYWILNKMADILQTPCQGYYTDKEFFLSIRCFVEAFNWQHVCILKVMALRWLNYEPLAEPMVT